MAADIKNYLKEKEEVNIRVNIVNIRAKRIRMTIRKRSVNIN